MDDLDFSVPPTPTRLGNVQRTNELFELLGGGEESFHDFEDESLSLLTGEVLQAQKCQLTELESKGKTLAKLQVQLKEGETSFESVVKEVESVNRQIFLLQERVEETRSTCTNLEQDIKIMLSQKRTLREHISNCKWNAIGERQILQKYRSKMATFGASVQTYLDESQLQKDVVEKETVLAKGKENLDMESLEKSCFEIETTTCDLKKFKEKLEAEITDLESQVNKEEHNFKMMEKENIAIQKRDSSSTSRWKQQINEIQQQSLTIEKQNNEMRLQLAKKNF